MAMEDLIVGIRLWLMDYTQANCMSEEQTRVALLERQAALQVKRDALQRRVKRAEAQVNDAKEEKRAIMEEIERLNKDLSMEAGKLIEDEVTVKEAVKQDQRETLEKFERLKSRLMLEKDRCVLAASQIREARSQKILSASSVDLEIGPLSDELSVEVEVEAEEAPTTKRTPNKKASVPWF